MTALAVNLFAAASLAFATDTTVEVGPHARLVLENSGGNIQVSAWDRDAVRVEADHSKHERVLVSNRRGVVSIGSRPRSGRPGRVNYRLTVPRGMAVNLSGTFASATVKGVKGDIAVRTVSGGIAVQGGSGRVSLSSILGPITVAGARGRLDVNSVSGPIQLSDIDGRILAETVNGSIALARIVSDSVNASTVSGSLCYDGSIRDGGWYRFVSHNGNIAVGVPDGAGATVSVATYGGRVEFDFPIRLKEQVGKRFHFRLGSGSAVLEMESFQGLIRLRRPGPGWVEGQPPCKVDDESAEEDEEEGK